MTRLPLRRALPPRVADFLLLSSLLLALACDPAPVQRPAEPAPQVKVVTIEQGAAYVPGEPAHVLPAYETAAERLAAQKNDAADDYRNQHVPWFAQTVPPAPGRYRPFGEWEEMQGVWTTYSNGMPGTKAVRRMFAQQTINFIRHSSPKVKAYVIVSGQKAGDDFGNAIAQYGITAEEKKYVTLVQIPNQTIWHIDYGPFPLIDKKDDTVAFADYMYYPNRYVDDAIPSRIGREFYKEVTTFKMPFPFEGGNIQSDGHSVCATTNRALSNTGFSALKVRNLLKKYNGCETTLITKDITDDGTGHIDMFFKWMSADHVLFGKYEDTITLDYDGDGNDETLPLPGAVNPKYAATFKKNQARMNDNEALFAAFTSPATGKKIKVSRLSMMTALRDSYGFLPRTFINSTFTNGVNVYPSYSEKSCRDSAGAACMKDADCKGEQYCSAGKCTAFSKNASGKVTLGSPKGCDELEGCAKGQECVTDPMKVALRAQVQKQWETAMPDWKHVGLHADRIALWSGAIHCITRTIPNKPFKKAMIDGVCLGGKCGCVEGGYNGTCAGNDECVGAELVCNCNICKGKCGGGGKSCTDDADCSTDGKTVVAGSCVINPDQPCKGQSGGGGCGSLGWEGTCDGKKLKYCSNTTAKQISCPNCCGWDETENSYSCLSTAACKSACVSECDKAGANGCSLQGTHAWQCTVDSEGCLKRAWLFCENGASCVDGKCVAPGGGSQTCPKDHGKDAGSTDTGSSSSSSSSSGGGDDAGSPPVDSGPVTQPDTSSSGGAVMPKPKGDDGGCTAASARGSSSAPTSLIAIVLLALLAVVRRRSPAALTPTRK